ncbi:hypothetical protein [Tenacibaculum ovolyticum]|uniref:hypothetical protein n=1 Tax=Tenacibaculum ovolyticum TaxID=104270 RepID=UPI001F255410|nr:hypothetical protein [Tenacibaculum ovolyticum]
MNKSEYIEFELIDNEKFKDLLKVYNIIANLKSKQENESDNFWLNTFPNYSLKYYSFTNKDLKPEFETAEFNDENWHFFSMTTHLVEDIEIELLECVDMENGKGRLNFNAYSYPYGGTDGLTTFLNSFGFKATEIDDGGDIYTAKWISNTKYKLKEK